MFLSCHFVPGPELFLFLSRPHLLDHQIQDSPQTNKYASFHFWSFVAFLICGPGEEFFWEVIWLSTLNLIAVYEHLGYGWRASMIWFWRRLREGSSDGGKKRDCMHWANADSEAALKGVVSRFCSSSCWVSTTKCCMKFGHDGRAQSNINKVQKTLLNTLRIHTRTLL